MKMITHTGDFLLDRDLFSDQPHGGRIGLIVRHCLLLIFIRVKETILSLCYFDVWDALLI